MTARRIRDNEIIDRMTEYAQRNDNTTPEDWLEWVASNLDDLSSIGSVDDIVFVKESA